ncbi:MAG: hypothetical protein LWX51_17460 [Deltaproteobacteria bacterium]|jgi:hypothetical protein|nr:hypothetical protein [Deltaproteobacteria bacterium]
MEFLRPILEGPLPNILVVGGLIFLFLFVVGKFGANIIVDPNKQKFAGFIGVLLLIAGLGLHFIPIERAGQENFTIEEAQPPWDDSVPLITELEEQIIFSYKDSDVSKHGFKLINVLAKCVHNPPQVNDTIEVEFTLQNVSKNPIKVLETFIIGRDPDGNNRDFGHSNEDKTIQPNETIKTERSITVDLPGEWKFGPSYHLGNDIYPGEWHRFPVRVEQ